MKNWYESKTIWYGILNVLIGFTAFIMANPKVGIVALINAALVITLRTLTTTVISPTELQ